MVRSLQPRTDMQNPGEAIEARCRRLMLRYRATLDRLEDALAAPAAANDERDARAIALMDETDAMMLERLILAMRRLDP